MTRSPKFLVIDIETRPSLGYIWKLWDENLGLSQLVEEGEMISFAAKWLGQKGTMFYSTFHDGKAAMVQAAWDLINEADAVIHFNGRKFDVPHLRREFLLHGLGAPSPIRQIDLLTIVKANFKFVSNKLDHVSQQMGLGQKTKHQGFDLWLGCMNDDPDSWKLMEKYNRQDVVLTEKLYKELRQWITSGHPHYALFAEAKNREEVQCDVCGSKDYQKRGPVGTNTGQYQQYRCNDCGHWFRSSKSIGRTTTRSIGQG